MFDYGVDLIVVDLINLLMNWLLMIAECIYIYTVIT